MITDLAGAPPDDVVLAPPHTILMTSSGKVRRAASREIYEGGRIGKPPKAAWWQVVRLTLGGYMPRLRRLARVIGTAIYGTYARCLFYLISPLVWLLVVVLPRPAWRWTVMRVGTRLLARASATPVAVQGLENLPPPDQPCVYVSNHASYLDGCLLVSYLPRCFSFVAKGELLGDFTARLFLQRIQTDFVERFDARKGVEDFQKMAAKTRAGRSYMFFPEGTFTRSPGMLRFHMGAFIAAAEAGVPIVPISIRGTRSILRGTDWLPHRGGVQIRVEPSITAEMLGLDLSDPWKAAVALCDEARTRVLKHCGEPDLILEKPPF